MAEWLKAPVSKTGISGNRDRGFESRPLRHSNIDTNCSEYISIDSKRAHCQPNKWRYKTILERCRSGLTGTPGKRVWGNSPQVRILSSPPHPIYKNHTPPHPTLTLPTPDHHTGLYPSFPRRRESTGWMCRGRHTGFKAVSTGQGTTGTITSPTQPTESPLP